MENGFFYVRINKNASGISRRHSKLYCGCARLRSGTKSFDYAITVHCISTPLPISTQPASEVSHAL